VILLVAAVCGVMSDAARESVVGASGCSGAAVRCSLLLQRSLKRPFVELTTFRDGEPTGKAQVNPDMTRVVVSSRMSDEEPQDAPARSKLLDRASGYLSSFQWCDQILESYFGLGVGRFVAVFLFRIRPTKPEVDEWLWVIVGDLPSAYLVTDQTPNPACALKTYIVLMRQWVEAVMKGESVEDLIPVNVEPDVTWAAELQGRLNLLEAELLPEYSDDLRACDDLSLE
jgi:hypothetical protein